MTVLKMNILYQLSVYIGEAIMMQDIVS